MTYSIIARRIGASALALTLGLALVQVARADQSDPEAPLPRNSGRVMQQSAELPPSPEYPWGSYTNPNAVPPWSIFRNGAGEVVDPRTGVAAPGQGENQGGG
jgi:hypothetical protein